MSDKPPPSVVLHFFAGGIGGTVGAAILCPLEVAKTRLQSSLYKSKVEFHSKNPLKIALFHIKGVFQMLRYIQQQEGVKALWKGLGANLVGVVPARAIYFAFYSQGKHVYTQLNNHQETSIVHMLSAATAGLATAMGTNPIWVAKTRMQLQSKEKSEVIYRNSLHCMKTILKQEGVRGLYKGLSASILGLSESTLQFVAYEYLKKLLQTRKMEQNRSHQAVKLEWTETFAAAATAKLFAAVISYPHEVLRTRLREAPEHGVVKYKGLISSAKLIIKEEGVAALYGGMAAHLMRVVPNAAILFFCYEAIITAATSKP